MKSGEGDCSVKERNLRLECLQHVNSQKIHSQDNPRELEQVYQREQAGEIIIDLFSFTKLNNYLEGENQYRKERSINGS